MQSSGLRKLISRLGFAKTSALLTVISVAISVIVTIIVLAFAGSIHWFSLLIAVIVPIIVSLVMSPLFLRLLFQLEKAETDLRKLAITDELTGAYNRRYFLQTAEREIARSSRFGKPFSTILLDIDSFKRINDSYGHYTGDEVLIAVTKACLRHCRKIDTFSRYGGDEFYFLLPECSRNEALSFAERIRAAVEQLQVYYGDTRIPITASIGVQAFEGAEDTLDSLLSRTDNAMYAAKQAGRNLVSFEVVAKK